VEPRRHGADSLVCSAETRLETQTRLTHLDPAEEEAASFIARKAPSIDSRRPQRRQESAAESTQPAYPLPAPTAADRSTSPRTGSYWQTGQPDGTHRANGTPRRQQHRHFSPHQPHDVVAASPPNAHPHPISLVAAKLEMPGFPKIPRHATISASSPKNPPRRGHHPLVEHTAIHVASRVADSTCASPARSPNGVRDQRRKTHRVATRHARQVRVPHRLRRFSKAISPCCTQGMYMVSRHTLAQAFVFRGPFATPTTHT